MNPLEKYIQALSHKSARRKSIEDVFTLALLGFLACLLYAGLRCYFII